MSFKQYIKEQTTSGDIATVDNKLGKEDSYKQKGKRCKKHKKINCDICFEEKWK